MNSQTANNNDGKRKAATWFVLGVTLLLWLATVFPSVFTQGWFYLDDPAQITFAKDGTWPLILKPDPMWSRYLPVFEGYRYAVYQLVGSSVAGFYWFQSMLFLATFLLAVYVVRRVTYSAVFPQLLTVIGLISFSLAEPAYTLGKHEPLLGLLLLLYIGTVSLFELREEKNREAILICSATCFLLAMAAMWNKETSLVFVVFLVPLLFLPEDESTFVNRLKCYCPIILASVAGLVAAMMPLQIVKHFHEFSSAASDYANFKANSGSIVGNIRFYATQLRDFFVIITMVIGLLALAFKQHRASREYRICSAAGTVAICYILGLLLWRWGCVYYSYPPQLMASIAFAIIAGLLIKSGGWNRRIAILACMIFILLKLAAVIPFVYISNVQKIESEVYSRGVKAFAVQPDVRENSKAGSEVRLYIENWPYVSEQPVQTELYLRGLLGINAKVIGAAEFISGDSSRDTKGFDYEAIPTTDQRIRPRIGDYVLSFETDFPAFFKARAVSPYSYGKPKFSYATGIELNFVSNFSKSFKWPTTLSLNLKKMYPKLIGSSYSLHRIDSLSGAGVWTGRQVSGLVGEESSLTLISDVPGAVRFRVTPFENALPNELIVKTGGVEYQRYQIDSTKSFEVFIPKEVTQANRSLQLSFTKSAPPESGMDARRISAYVDVISPSNLKMQLDNR